MDTIFLQLGDFICCAFSPMQVVLSWFSIQIDEFCLLATNTLFKEEAGKELSDYSLRDEAASPQVFQIT